MKIVRDIPEQLIIEDRAIFITAIVGTLGFMFVASGLIGTFHGDFWFGFVWTLVSLPLFGVLLLLFARRNQLILDAVAGTMTHRRKTLLGYSQVIHDLAELDRAEVETSRSSDGDDTYRMVLILKRGMDAGPHPFTEVYTSGRGAERGTDAVNRWLDALRARG